MHYEEPTPISRDEATEALSSHDPNVVCDALIRVVFSDLNRSWAEKQCLAFIGSPNPVLRGCAVTCLAHIARLHHAIDPSVLPRLEQMRGDADIGGRVEDAIEDIRLFVRGGP